MVLVLLTLVVLVLFVLFALVVLVLLPLMLHLTLFISFCIGGGGASFEIGEVFRLVHAATGNALVKGGVILARF